jgi:hypothetical protein
MSRIRSSSLALAAVALLVLAGCGDQESLLGPTSSDDPQLASRGGGGTGLVTVVHGVPGLTVDVWVNGAKTLPSFEPGTVTEPLELPEDNYDIAILPENGSVPEDAVITGSVTLPAGANASIVAYLATDGTPSLKAFVNDVSRTRGIRSRVVVRHLAEAPTVDVRLFRQWFRWWPVRTIRNLSNPNEAQTDIWPGRLQAKIYPAGSRDAIFTTPRVPFYPNESTIVYAIGTFPDTFGVLVQKIDLPRRGGWGGWGDDDDDDLAFRVNDQLPLEEYDRMAVENRLDEEEITVDVR